METMATSDWLTANQRYLAAALQEVRARLARQLDGGERPDSTGARAESAPELAAQMSPPPALESLCRLLRLSPFEKNVVMLCAGAELDSKFTELFATAQGNPTRPYPTFSLALAALDAPHWSALSPRGPLRYWYLLEVGSGSALTSSPLKIDERILHYLTGQDCVDERLADFVQAVPPAPDLAPSHQGLAADLALAWSRVQGRFPLPVMQLCGGESPDRHAIAFAGAVALGLVLYALPAPFLPLDLRELKNLVRLWEREAYLNNLALLLDCEGIEAADHPRVQAVTTLLETLGVPVLVSAPERWRLPRRALVTFEVLKPASLEQLHLWQALLGEAPEKTNGRLEPLVSQFNLSLPAIRTACAEAWGADGGGETSPESGEPDLATRLWDACRLLTRPRLSHLAQRIEPAAVWEDLVLPAPQKEMLRDIARHVRHRLQVYEAWGFAAKSTRGLGISAVFVGPSGTGKTMAAEVLARELRLDLYRIDLSQVVSKYIGETEKNLKQVFDAAEDGGAILLFDEADALFGKRSEVKDSHDRYANIEVSYLLQRMESYRGLAILTTNLKDAMDRAFLRRLRFVVAFPFPDPALRAEIWQNVFPGATPLGNLDIQKLSRLNVTGGHIRNIAMNAAFLAADAGSPVNMGHLLRAARQEYAKMEKTLTEVESSGWE